MSERQRANDQHLRNGGGMSTRGIALITGATSGIGLASVTALAADGWRVVATARAPGRAAALTELAAATDSVETRPLDVTIPESVTQCVQSVLADHGCIDLLLNNAGAGHRGTLEQLDDAELRGALELNFLGVARVTRAVIPGMRTRRAGRIVTVTSSNGVIALPFSDTYNASKFAVEGLLEGLAPVLATFGVFVSILEPGPVRTAFLRNAGGRTGEIDGTDPYAELLSRYNATMAGLLGGGQTPESVAEVIAGIARDPRPHLRYQSSPAATALAGRKLVDPTGDSIVAATTDFLRHGPDGVRAG